MCCRSQIKKSYLNFLRLTNFEFKFYVFFKSIELCTFLTKIRFFKNIFCIKRMHVFLILTNVWKIYIKIEKYS